MLPTRNLAKTSRFSQGVSVDRFRPHIFHRDYVGLCAIRDGVAGFVADHAKELEGGTVLDYGADVSPYAPYFVARGITLLRADIGEPPPGVLQIDSRGRLPLQDEVVDAIISTQVLEHVTDVAAYLGEAWRVLRSNGLFYCSTHGNYLLHRHPTDLWRWTIDGLAAELSRAGFNVETIVPRIGMLATATHHRAIALGALTRGIPLTGWLRPIIYFVSNLRMLAEERITPARARNAFPEILIGVARKKSMAVINTSAAGEGRSTGD
jgi:SAM-dependent methyltransferase